MAEYIERKAALLATDILDEYLTDCERLYFVKQIKAIPAADVVEVVRCRDCKYYRQNTYSPDEDMMCMCWCDWLPTDPDDFCSYGVRKTD